MGNLVKEELNTIMEDAISNFKSGNLDEAMVLFKKIISFDKNNYQSIYNLGIIYSSKNDYEEAINNFLKAFQLNKSEKYFTSIIDVYLISNQFDKANKFINNNIMNFKNEFKETILEKLEYKKNQNHLIELYNDINDDHIAKSIIDKIEEYTKNYKHDPLGWKLLGSVYLKKDYIDESVKSFEIAYKLNNQDIEVILALGSLYREKKEYEKALVLYSIAKKTLPNNFDVHFNCGNILLEQKKLIEASLEFEKAIEIDPKSYPGNQNLAKTYKELNKINESKNIYKKMIELDINNAIGYRGLGAIYILEGQLYKAEKLILKSLEIEPENPDAYQNLSIAYFRMGRNNEGMKLMRENAGVISFTIEKSRGNIQVLKG